MKAVIIAAGMGKRIGSPDMGRPKPLIRLLGLPIILRNMLAAKEAGIKEFVVVTGYLGNKIREELGDGSKYKLKIHYVENQQWEKGNGLSLLKAEGFVSEKFVLMMADHLFDSSIIKDVVRARIAKDEVALMVDYNPADYIDMDDATKVRVAEGYIKGLDKGFSEYDGVDCGIFLCTTYIFKKLKETIDQGKDTITDVMNRVAMEGKLKAIDVGERFWIDIDTEEALKRAEKILCKKLIKPTDGFVSRFINRPVSLRISRWLVNKDIKPNTLTLVSFSVSVLAALLLSIGTALSAVVGGLMVQLSSILDGCDGEVARLKYQSSAYGAWLDSVLDRYSDAVIILGLILGLYHYRTDLAFWLVGYFALMGSLISSYTATKYDAIVKTKKKGYFWRFGRDTRLFLIMIGTLLNEMYYLLLMLALLTNFVSIRRLYVLRDK